MVWMGTYTQTFMPPISAQNARILEQTKQRVAAAGSGRGARWPMPDNCSAHRRRVLPHSAGDHPDHRRRADHVPGSVFTKDDQKKIFGPLSIVGLLAALVAAVAARWRSRPRLPATC